MYRKVVLVFFISIIFCRAYAQGKIVLVGGGPEDDNSWSDAPYAWAVEHSANKRVAVISYANETEFIPDYFQRLGAVAANNIRINSRSLADQGSMYDSLMKYDVFFFKGGDQSFYYKYFKDTRVADAVRDKFAQGGVIAGTSAGTAILSEVVFTAEQSSVYPDEALSDFKSSSITLADDLFHLLPGFIVDSHFTERGRAARMFAFLANWNFKHGEWLTGIGVDDQTALCIDPTNKAVVFGTGSVSFYRTTSITAYQDEKPVADSIGVIQLLHGHSIQLPQLTILAGPENLIQPLQERDKGTYSIIMSGSDDLASNSTFLDEFIQQGDQNDSILVVTAVSKGTAYIDALRNEQLPVTVLETKAANNGDDQTELRDVIRRSKKIIFVDNDDNALFAFLDGGKTGALVRSHIFRNNILSGFVGEDSRYAGKVFVTNHLGYLYAAYYGELNYRRGLNLLRSSTVMSNTYDASTTDFYENTTASVSYAMVKDSLRYGIYLNRNSYMKFDHENLVNYFEARGTHSAMILVSNDSKTEFASAPVNAAGDVRNYVAFSNAHYVLLNGPARLIAGGTQPSEDQPYEWETVILSAEDEIATFSPYPNPTTGIFYYDATRPTEKFGVTVFDSRGMIVFSEDENAEKGSVDLSAFSSGIYLVRFTRNRGVCSKRITLQR